MDKEELLETLKHWIKEANEPLNLNKLVSDLSQPYIVSPQVARSWSVLRRIEKAQMIKEISIYYIEDYESKTNN